MFGGTVIEAALRREFIRLCCNPKTRVVPRFVPHKWDHHKVLEPDGTGWYFTQAGAWEFFVRYLEQEHPWKIVSIERPPTWAVSMVVPGGGNHPPIYMKVDFSSGVAVARSFHYST